MGWSHAVRRLHASVRVCVARNGFAVPVSGTFSRPSIGQTPPRRSAVHHHWDVIHMPHSSNSTVVDSAGKLWYTNSCAASVSPITGLERAFISGGRRRDYYAVRQDQGKISPQSQVQVHRTKQRFPESDPAEPHTINLVFDTLQHTTCHGQ